LTPHTSKTRPLTPHTSKFSKQTLSSRIGENTEFIFLQLEGEIDEDIIENIENAKNYLGDLKYEKIQEIIKDNTGKKTRYGTPEDCITGILENSLKVV
jgi:hypothetical protein